MVAHTEISPYTLDKNVFSLIDRDWMLITAGNRDGMNTMTASWGAMGILWHKPVSFIFVRPVRYTYQFLERNDLYTLSFFGEEYRKALQLCGSRSGRDCDKVGLAGLTLLPLGENSVSFLEASLIMQCRKLYFQDIIPSRFLDSAIDNNYPQKDYHRMYIGAVEKVLIRDSQTA